MSTSVPEIEILFVISIQTHGNGGHFHSLNHISKFLADHYSVGIVTIGRGESEVLRNNPYFLGHISLKGWNYFAAKKQAQNFVTRHKIKYVNCFDWPALSVMGIMLRRNKVILAHTKCGGPNVPYPPVENLVLFSQENADYFNSELDLKISNMAVISNRVGKLSIDKQASLEVSDKFTFVAISRIGSAYYKNLDKSLKLIADLARDGKEVELIIIGTVEKEEYLTNLQRDVARLKLPVKILTSAEYTTEASRFIRFGNAFIGSGRGVMEACSLGMPVLSHATNLDIPVLLDDDTFFELYRKNFSPRSKVAKGAKDAAYSKILSVINDKETRSIYSKLCTGYFNKHFSLDSSLAKYIDFYKNAKSWEFNRKAHSGNIARALFRFYKPA